MDIVRLAGFMAIVPMTICLTISFFVLVALRGVTEKILRGIGLLTVALLWVSASLFATVGAYTVSTGKCPMMLMMNKMHGSSMPGYYKHKKMMKGGMMRQDMPAPMSEGNMPQSPEGQ